MICFEVRVNGYILCTAGADNVAVLTAIRSWDHHSPRGLHFHVGGLTGRAADEKEFIDWDQDENLNLSPGDEITIRIVEQASADPPLRRRPAKEVLANRGEGGG